MSVKLVKLRCEISLQATPQQARPAMPVCNCFTADTPHTTCVLAVIAKRLIFIPIQKAAHLLLCP
ncbi:hypothetical protein KC218_24985, partial [Mycobacterium tuberculosis]|nr:hypothetical protein [Mycobacterium tuberculosis]